LQKTDRLILLKMHGDNAIKHTTMKAIIMTAKGGSEVLVYQDIPEPAITLDNEIKVRLAAAGVNPVDTKIRSNGLFFDLPLPAVLGCDGAGIVVECGAKAQRFKVGDKVWFCHGGLGREPGNYAEFNVLDERWAVPMPTNLSFEEAAALPLVLITAWGGLFARGGLQAGQTVLIHAGAGGVGHVAIQLAKLKGATVLTTIGDADKADFVKRLGADYAINYKTADVLTEVLRLTNGQGADLVFDTVGGDVFKDSIPMTAHFGRLITLLAVSGVDLTEARLRNLLIGFELMLTPMLRDLDMHRQEHMGLLQECARLIESGKLKGVVSHVFPLRQAAAAHELIETGHTQGKIVLKIDGL
jgi:NADPH:quinone reductase